MSDKQIGIKCRVVAQDGIQSFYSKINNIIIVIRSRHITTIDMFLCLPALLIFGVISQKQITTRYFMHKWIGRWWPARKVGKKEEEKSFPFISISLYTLITWRYMVFQTYCVSPVATSYQSRDMLLFFFFFFFPKNLAFNSLKLRSFFATEVFLFRISIAWICHKRCCMYVLCELLIMVWEYEMISGISVVEAMCRVEKLMKKSQQ